VCRQSEADWHNLANGIPCKKNSQLIDSNDIARIELIEGGEYTIPFTNQAFDSDGVVVFKNMNALIDSVEIMAL